jgi:hypothetical protein
MATSPGPSATRYRWAAAGDVNAFFGLMLDNVMNLVILAGILISVFKMPSDVVYTRMFPGTAFGVVFETVRAGNAAMAAVGYAPFARLEPGAERPLGNFGSLDHSLWFHRVPRVDEWFFNDVQALTVRDSRGVQLLADALTFAEERFYTDTADELSRIPRARDRLIRLIELSCSTEGSTSDDWMDEYILWLDLWARSPRDPEVAKNREILDRRWRTAIVDIVRDGQAAGEFKPVDAEDFALLLASLVDGLAIQVVLGDPEVSVDRMRKMCLRVTASELGFDLPTRRRAKAGSASKRATAR